MAETRIGDGDVKGDGLIKLLQNYSIDNLYLWMEI